MRISGQQLAAQLLDEAEPLDEKSSSLESQQVCMRFFKSIKVTDILYVP